MTKHDDTQLCAWCGEPFRQNGVGRARVYCKQSCRELAYRDRKTDRLIAEALAAAGADASMDHARNRQLTEPETRESSVDETPPPAKTRSRGVTPGGKRPLLPPPPGART